MHFFILGLKHVTICIGYKRTSHLGFRLICILALGSIRSCIFKLWRVISKWYLLTLLYRYRMSSWRSMGQQDAFTGGRGFVWVGLITRRELIQAIAISRMLHMSAIWDKSMSFILSQTSLSTQFKDYLIIKIIFQKFVCKLIHGN